MSIPTSEKKELKPFPHCPLCGELPKDPATNHGAWTLSSDEEVWPGDYDFEKKEDAIAEAEAGFEGDLEPGDRFWIGQKKLYRPHNVEVADMIVEQLGEAAYEQCGECAEEWPDVTPAQTKELDEAVAKIVHAWIHKNDLLPNFFTLTSVEQHLMPEPDSLGADPPRTS